MGSLLIAKACGTTATGAGEGRRGGTAEIAKQPGTPPGEESLPTSTEDQVDRQQELVKVSGGPAQEIVIGLPPKQTWEEDSELRLDGDEAELFDAAIRAEQRGEVDESVAIIDVLLVQHPDNLEYLEFRGMLQLRQGHVEDAKQDLHRCCDGGRASCCRVE